MSDSHHTVVTVTPDELRALERFNAKRVSLFGPVRNEVRAIYFRTLRAAIDIANAERAREIERMGDQ